VDGERDRTIQSFKVGTQYQRREKGKRGGRMERKNNRTGKIKHNGRLEKCKKKAVGKSKISCKISVVLNPPTRLVKAFLNLFSSLSVSVCGHCSKGYPSLSNMLHRCYGDKSCHI
jgi:hypothetical protein